MSTNHDEQLERLLATYRDQVAGLADTQARLAAISCSATAPRQTVTATVGNQGEILDLKFPTDAYKRMAPKELSNAILTTIREAREKSLAEAAAILAPMLPDGMDAHQIVSGKADLRSLMPREPHSVVLPR
jgi:DNA-binding protein YbaB